MNSKYAFQFGIAVVAIMLLTAVPVVAQPGFGPRDDKDPEERLEMRVGFLDERLDLSDEQVESLRAILEDAQKEAMAWRDEHADATRNDRRSFFEEHRAATSAKIKEMLNEDQKEDFEKLKERRGHLGRGERGRKGMGARDGHRGRGLRALDLTDEQKEAIREILTEEQRATLDRMLSDGARDGFRGRGRHGGGPGMLLNQLDLTEEQQEQIEEMHKNHRAAAKAWHDANPEATREERHAFREAHQEGMKKMLESVLTEEQIETLDSLRADRPMGPGGGRRGGMHGRK